MEYFQKVSFFDLKFDIYLVLYEFVLYITCCVSFVNYYTFL